MINFVIGPACSGKSKFIETQFPHALVIDLWDFQKDYKLFNIENILQSYKKAKDALITTIEANPGSDIVLEHTLLKAARRAPYLDEVREVTNQQIVCYVLKPDIETYEKFCQEREVPESYYEFELLEMPSKGEGFEKIFVIKPNLNGDYVIEKAN